MLSPGAARFGTLPPLGTHGYHPSVMGKRALLTALMMMMLAAACTGGTPSGSTPSATPPASPEEATPSLVAMTVADLPLELRPYPYVEPMAGDGTTALDGTYMNIVALEQLGGPEHALPFHCRRCLPYERDPGVNTMILWRGIYYVHHQMSGWRSLGNFEIDDDTLFLFNDPNCSSIRGEYRFELAGGTLRLDAVDDPCAYEGERALDLATDPWIRIPVCRRDVEHLWPGLLGCPPSSA